MSTTTPMTRRKGRRVNSPAARCPWPTGSKPLKPHDREPMPYYRFLAELRRVPAYS